ncbi:MAG: transposase [Phycisphaerae bacterium]
MNDRDFVAGVRKEVLDANLQIYRQMFAESDAEKATDSYAREALRFYASLDDSNKEMLFKIIRQVMVDTISNLFGVFDGVTKLPQQPGPVTVELSGQRLDGTLQDQFLEMEEQQASK